MEVLVEDAEELGALVGDDLDVLGHGVLQHGYTGLPAHRAEPAPGGRGRVVRGERAVRLVWAGAERPGYEVLVASLAAWELAAKGVRPDRFAAVAL